MRPCKARPHMLHDAQGTIASHAAGSYKYINAHLLRARQQQTPNGNSEVLAFPCLLERSGRLVIGTHCIIACCLLGSWHLAHLKRTTVFLLTAAGRGGGNYATNSCAHSQIYDVPGNSLPLGYSVAELVFMDSIVPGDTPQANTCITRPCFCQCSRKRIRRSIVLADMIWRSPRVTSDSSSYTQRLCTATKADTLLALAPKSVSPRAVCIIVGVLWQNMKPDGRRLTSSWRNVSSLAGNFILGRSQPRLIGYIYVRMRSRCLKLNYNWQIPKCDRLVYNLCANITSGGTDLGARASKASAGLPCIGLP